MLGLFCYHDYWDIVQWYHTIPLNSSPATLLYISQPQPVATPTHLHADKKKKEKSFYWFCPDQFFSSFTSILCIYLNKLPPHNLQYKSNAYISYCFVGSPTSLAPITCILNHPHYNSSASRVKTIFPNPRHPRQYDTPAIARVICCLTLCSKNNCLCVLP